MTRCHSISHFPNLFALLLHPGGRGTPAWASSLLPGGCQRVEMLFRPGHSLTVLQPPASPLVQPQRAAASPGAQGRMLRWPALPGRRRRHALGPDSHRRAPPPPTRPRAPPAVSARGVPESPQVSPSPDPHPGAPSRPPGAAALPANSQAPAAPASPRRPLFPGQASTAAWSPGCRLLTRELERPGQHCRHGGGPPCACARRVLPGSVVRCGPRVGLRAGKV